MNLGQMLSFIGQPPPSTPMPNEFGMSAGGGGGGKGGGDPRRNPEGVMQNMQDTQAMGGQGMMQTMQNPTEEGPLTQKMFGQDAGLGSLMSKIGQSGSGVGGAK